MHRTADLSMPNGYREEITTPSTTILLTDIGNDIIQIKLSKEYLQDIVALINSIDKEPLNTFGGLSATIT